MTFPNRDQLRKHISRKHERRIVCDICHKTAHKEYQEKKITDIELNQKLEFTFSKKSALKKHMFEVHESGFFICESHCGRRFKS